MTLPADAKMGYEVTATIAGKTDGIRDVNFNNSAAEADITDQNCAGKQRTKAGIRKHTFTCSVLWGSEAYTTIAAAFVAGTAVAVTHDEPSAPAGLYAITGFNPVRGINGPIEASCTFAYYGAA